MPYPGRPVARRWSRGHRKAARLLAGSGDCKGGERYPSLHVRVHQCRVEPRPPGERNTSTALYVPIPPNIIQTRPLHEGKKKRGLAAQRITTTKSLFSGSFTAIHQPGYRHTNNIKHKEDFHRTRRGTGKLKRCTKGFRDKESANRANG